MIITLNGEARTVDAGTSLQHLLDSLEVNCDALVVQRNDDIVARTQFSSAPLEDGDTLELVRFVGGG